MRGFAVDAPAGVEHQVRALLADQARQRMRQPETGMEAELDEVRREARLRTRDAKVRHQRKTKTAADRGTVDRADDRFLRAEQTHRRGIQRVAAGRGASVAFACCVRSPKFAPAQKCLPCAHNTDARHFDIAVERIERIAERIDQRDVEEVVGRALDLEDWPRGLRRVTATSPYCIWMPLCVARRGAGSLYSAAVFAMLYASATCTGQRECSRGKSVT